MKAQMQPQLDALKGVNPNLLWLTRPFRESFRLFPGKSRRTGASLGSRIAVASSLLAPRTFTNRANPRVNASANASSRPRVSSSM